MYFKAAMCRLICVRISYVTGWIDRFPNDLNFVRWWGVKLYSQMTNACWMARAWRIIILVIIQHRPAHQHQAAWMTPPLPALALQWVLVSGVRSDDGASRPLLRLRSLTRRSSRSAHRHRTVTRGNNEHQNAGSASIVRVSWASAADARHCLDRCGGGGGRQTAWLREASTTADEQRRVETADPLCSSNELVDCSSRQSERLKICVVQTVVSKIRFWRVPPVGANDEKLQATIVKWKENDRKSKWCNNASMIG